MIYSTTKESETGEFENFLDNVKKSVLDDFCNYNTDYIKKISGSDFEYIVYDNCIRVSAGTVFEGNIFQTEDRQFPDIVANDYFGIEVKATKKMTGNQSEIVF